MRKSVLLTASLILVLSAAAMAGASDEEIPDIYQGVTTLSTTGEREWTVTDMGEGGGKEHHCKETIRESAEVQVPAVYIRAGIPADPKQLGRARGSAERKLYIDGQLMEYWTCPDQIVPPMHNIAQWAYMIAIPMYDVYQLGLKFDLKGEHGTYDKGTKTWRKEQRPYSLHGFDVKEISMPEESDRLSGQKTEVFDGWIKATLFWDWKPAVTQ